MPKSPSTQFAVPGLFNAGDMHDAHELAACDLRWMNSALSHIHSTLRNLAETHAVNSPFITAELTGLINHMEMYRYLADDRCRNHEQLAEDYKEQLEGNKGANHG